MQYVHLGNSNVKVSKFCLGTMMFGGKTSADESVRITRSAVEAGVNFIDTADVYTEQRCETILGEALAGIRDKVFLASKGGMVVGKGPNDTGCSRYHLITACENSLKRLKTDRIDLYYVHWPFTQMNLHEMMRALDDLVRAGKVVYPACSNFPAWLVMRSQWIADVEGFAPLVCGQYPYNLIERGMEIELLPMAQAMKWGTCIYRPIAIGVLTGKYLGDRPAGTRSDKDERIDKWATKYRDGVEKLVAYAKEIAATTTGVANAWVASHPGVSSVILGVSSMDQLEANLKDADLTLTQEQRAKVSSFFPTEVFEEAGGAFANWRRRADIL